MKTESSLQSALFDSRQFAICLLDKSGILLEFSNGFQNQFTDLTTHSILKKSVWSLLIWPEDFPIKEKVWEKLKQNGYCRFSQYLQVGSKRSLYEIDFRQINDFGEVLAEFNPVGKDLNPSSSASNIGHDQKEFIDRLASLISHSLRAPIANTAYLLSMFGTKEIGKDELVEFVDTLKKSNEQTLSIIDEMGELMNENLKQKKEAEVSLQSMISDVMEKFDEQISKTKARVVVDIQDHKIWKVPQGAFQMILGHVISNSLKYRKTNETPKIVITCSCKKGDRIIEVMDNGLGFDVDENKHRLFGMFQTFHDHPDARGIGLFQVKNRLLSIGGEVSLISQKGIGTTVTLNFKQNELEEAPLHH